MKPFWQMLLTCGMVWVVTGMAVVAWLRFRMRYQTADNHAEPHPPDRRYRRAEQRLRRPAPKLETNRPPAKSDRELLNEVREMDCEAQISLLKGGEPRMRLIAAAALEESREESALDALIDALSDPEPELVAIILKNLAGQLSVKAVDAFLDHIDADQSIAYHPSLIRRKFDYRQDDLVDWLGRRAVAGDPDVIGVIEGYASAKAVEVLIGILQGDAIPLWDRRREAAAESVARLYLSDLVGVSERERIETLEGVVWIDSRAYKEVYDQGELVRLREPANKTIWDFIVVGRAKERKRPAPIVDAVELLASLAGDEGYGIR